MAIPESNNGLHYSKFISDLCSLREARTYLEIGVQHGFNLSQVSVDTAIAIDPGFIIAADPSLGKKSVHLYRMTSDHFFSSAHSDFAKLRGVDFAFLDGMHLFEFLLRDFFNTEKICNPNGLIALHDCIPFDGEMIERVNNTEGRSANSKNKFAWTGDVWKVVSILQKYRPDLRVVLVDCEPTGLVFITNLDPTSRALEDNYLDIVKAFHEIPNNSASLDAFFGSQQIIEASSIIENFNHTLYFKL